MSDHLPECLPDIRVELFSSAGDRCQTCDALRACEQRVREDERNRCKPDFDIARAEGYAKGIIEGDKGGRREGHRIGYRKGVSDERERIRKAVEALRPLELDDSIGGWDADALKWTHGEPLVARSSVLAVIDNEEG